MVEETDVGEEGRCKEYVSEHRCELDFEVSACVFPSVFLGREIVEEVLAAADFVLDFAHVSYDLLLLADQCLVLSFKKFCLLLEFVNGLTELAGLLFEAIALFLEFCDFSSHGVNASEDVCVGELRLSPSC